MTIFMKTRILNALHYPISYDDELERVDADLVGVASHLKIYYRLAMR